MSKSYRLFKANSFPEIDSEYILPAQIKLLADKEVPDTVIRRQNLPLSEGFESFYIVHHVLKQQIGLAKGVPFTEYLAEFHLWSFYRRSDGLLIVQGNKDAVADLFYALNRRGHENFAIQSYTLDFDKLEAHIQRIKGSWFSFKSATLHAKGLLGAHVDIEPEYEEAKKLGTLTSIKLVHTFHGADISLWITRRAAVVIMQEVASIPLEIDIILDVKQQLLDKGLEVVERRGKAT